MHESEQGSLLETWVLHELRAHMQLAQCGGELSWYRTGGGVEVDSFWTGPDVNVGIEVKASARWRTEAGHALRELLDRKVIRHALAVYLGERTLVDGGVHVLPARVWATTLGKYLR